MSRCKACDTPFGDSDFLDLSHREEDLCSFCRFVAFNPNLFNTKEYQFESMTEVPTYIENYNYTVDKS